MSTPYKNDFSRLCMHIFTKFYFRFQKTFLKTYSEVAINVMKKSVFSKNSWKTAFRLANFTNMEPVLKMQIFHNQVLYF